MYENNVAVQPNGKVKIKIPVSEDFVAAHTFVYFTDGYAPIGIRPLKDMIWISTSDGNKQNYPGKTKNRPKVFPP